VWRSPLPEPKDRTDSAGSLAAPMPGQVVGVLVAEGQAVRAGDPLLVLEAMKMEHIVRAPHDGTVVSIRFGPGDKVDSGAPLAEVREHTNTES
jgi:biotin carboxyl carrier protein